MLLSSYALSVGAKRLQADLQKCHVFFVKEQSCCMKVAEIEVATWADADFYPPKQ